MEYQLEDLAKVSFKYFFTQVLKYHWASHHDEWNDLIQNNSRILIECARGHGKTFFFVSYCIWLVYRSTSQSPVDILFISYSEDQVKNNIMNLIDKVINQNDYLSSLRPDSKQQWGAQLKSFKNGSQIRGESFGSSVRGAHPTHLFVDDPLKDKGGMTPEEQGDYFRTSLMGTVIRNTQVVVVGTPLDNGDLLEQLEQNKTFVFKAYPAENEERTKALFPYLFTLDELHKIEETDGSFAYSRERLLKRIDPHSQMFKDKYRTINTSSDYPQAAVVRTIIDPAISEKEGACDSAIVTVLVDYKNHKWELDTRLIHADDPNTLLNEIVKVAGQFHKGFYDYAVVMEAELFQKVLANDLKQKFLDKNWSINVIEVVHQGIQGKHERIAGLQPAWEARSIHLLPESPLISQFRYYRPRIKGFKIDGLDAFAWIRAEDVAQPMANAKVYDPGVPNEAYE